ncbi:727c438f-d456-4ded-b45e-b435cd019361 [Sclerotinia trifoliorum]|uniref:727c438f-d456-4ded-b45e-b435cd019361 n=1 Tax=Sclerotinia trifoliorum TaxID=28548 RepID=A0A8H2W0S2_9HELO|nr:727c438f-d456-4ded-b45e-b435cd019361 [Sclerotinia trifoliorum]
MSVESNIISTGPDPPGTNYPVSANAITLPIFSIIFIFLLLVPFRLLYRVNNIAACSLVIINIISLLFVSTNAIVWPTDSLSNRWSGHILCDIQVLIRQAFYTAMTSTTCCISMFLARAVDTDNALIYRLRRHRSNFASTLSSSSSGLSPRRFFKLFTMSLILLIVYFPVVIWYFYLNVSWPLHAYSWSQVHDPLFWNLIVFWRLEDAPAGMEYDSWNWVSLAFMIVVFWGCNSEGVEVYRRAAVSLGFARFWPRLRMTFHERRIEKMERDNRTGLSGTGTVGSWKGKFDLISRTVNYFEAQEEKSRKHSVGTTTTLGDDITHTSTRKPSHQTQISTSTTTNSTYNSRNATIYDSNSSAHKQSVATATPSIIDHDISFSSSAPTCADQDVISPFPRTLSPNNVYSHVPEATDASEITAPPPTSRGMWGMFRTHLNPLPLHAFSTHGKGSESSSSLPHHSKSKSLSHPKNQERLSITHEKSTIPGEHLADANNAATLTTQIWSSANDSHDVNLQKGSNASLLKSGNGNLATNNHGEDEEYDQDDILASPKPGTRAYRERERLEMISEKEDRKKEREKKILEKESMGDGNGAGKEDGEGLNVKKTFGLVEERDIDRTGSS